MQFRTTTLFLVLSCVSTAFPDPPLDPPAGPAPITQSLAQQLVALPPGQSLPVWVFFADKGIIAPADYAQRAAELPPAARARRRLRRTAPGLVDFRDMNVNPSYVAAVQVTGATLRRQSRWLNAVSVNATASQVAAIAGLPFVHRIQPVAVTRHPTPIDEPAPPPTASPTSGDPAYYGPTYNQLNQIGIVAAHVAGYTGSGIVIGVLDTGFRRTHNVFNQTDATATPPIHPLVVLSEYDYVKNDANTAPQTGDAAGQSDHGTMVLSSIGGYYPTVYVGAAPDASFRLAKTEDIATETPVEEDNYVAAIEDFETQGVDVATSSLGYLDFDSPFPGYTHADLDGLTAVTTLAVNAATENGMVCCTAAGNDGHDTNPATLHLIAPADAFKVLTCGSVSSSGTISSFSSDGPSADGRVKPEVLARGSSTSLISPTSTTVITSGSGTSFATPLVAGGVSLIVQAHPNWNVDRIRRALFHTAAGFIANSTFDATHVRGYGIINVMAAINYVEGDIDGNGKADGADVSLFLSTLIGTNTNTAQRQASDLDASGAITPADVPIFVEALLNP